MLELFWKCLDLSVILSISYAIILMIHRLVFHPLRKYPGPLLNKLTDWPNVYRSIRGDRYNHLHRLHQLYGPIVRFGPNRVSFCTSKCLIPIYGFRANTRKADWYNIWELVFGSASTATTLDRKLHAKRKRIMQSAFAENVLKNNEPILLKNVDVFCQQLSKHASSMRVSEGPSWGSPINLSQTVGYLTFDTMGETTFSKSFDMQTSTKQRHWLNLSQDALWGMNALAFMPFLVRLKVHVLFPTLYQGLLRFKKYCADQSDDRIARANEIKAKDVWSQVIDVADSATGYKFSPEDLQSEVAILVTVGSHPMRTTISALTHYLLRNPRCMEILTRELRNTFLTAAEIGMGSKLSSCEYLRACIMETLRMSPSLPGIPQRTANRGGVFVDGNFFPEGTVLGVSTYALQHSEDYVKDPWNFIPERWSTTQFDGSKADYQTPEALEKVKEAFCAFSFGPDGCLGKGMTWHQVSIISARMFWEFEVRSAPGHGAGKDRVGEANQWALHGEYPLNDRFSAEGDGPWIQVRRHVSDPKTMGP